VRRYSKLRSDSARLTVTFQLSIPSDCCCPMLRIRVEKSTAFQSAPSDRRRMHVDSDIFRFREPLKQTLVGHSIDIDIPHASTVIGNDHQFGAREREVPSLRVLSDDEFRQVVRFHF